MEYDTILTHVTKWNKRLKKNGNRVVLEAREKMSFAKVLTKSTVVFAHLGIGLGSAIENLL